MPRDVFTNPAGQTGYKGEEKPLKPVDAPARHASEDAEGNRGKPAPREGSGAVIGSGAGAGGSGAPEDYADDPQAGGGHANLAPDEKRPDKGGDAPIGGSH